MKRQGMNMQRFKIPNRNEDGLVALVVVTIIVILLALTTTAFTKLMGRESRQALDRQLSTQAYYAAETGINDARDYLNLHPGVALAGDNCDETANHGYPPYLGRSKNIDNKVTCVLSDSTPEELFFDVQDGQSKIFEMRQATTPFDRILVSWENVQADGKVYQPADYKSGPASFPNSASWNTPTSSAPVLEVTYYPMPLPPQPLTNLYSRGRTIFLYPSATNPGSNASTYSSDQPDGSTIDKSCQSSRDVSGGSASFPGADLVYYCNTVISPTVFPSLVGLTTARFIFVKITAIYGHASVIIRAQAGGVASNIQDAQALIDATGKGNDVLKRLQTSIDYRPEIPEPSGSMETVIGLCKRLELNLSTTPAQPQLAPSADGDPVTSQACHYSSAFGPGL
jgi:Tfp pilus assembly protein PilX